MNNKLLIILLLAGAGYFLLNRSGGQSVNQMRKTLLDMGEATDVINRMSDQEIKDTYDFIFNYIKKQNRNIPPDLKSRIETISKKYNIFT